jgi:hypothetical protein
VATLFQLSRKLDLQSVTLLGDTEMSGTDDVYPGYLTLASLDEIWRLAPDIPVSYTYGHSIILYRCNVLTLL